MSKRVALLVAPLLLGSVVTFAPGARAQAPPSDPLIADSLAAVGQLVSKAGADCQLKDAADDETTANNELPFVLCDDGLPPAEGGSQGIPVPVAYNSSAAGNDWSGLPRPAPPEEVTEKDARYDLQPEATGDRITLDVDITLPPSRGLATEYEEPSWPIARAPKTGFPVVVLMHGCCSGNKKSWEAATVDASNELWHQSNAWFASRGYVVINYTARGFRDMNNRGSTGTTQLDSRSYELNDFQYLVGLLVDHDAQRRAAGLKPIFNVDPTKVATVGEGFAWLALTDPRWKSPVTKTPVKLAAVAPRYGWTDLVESLLPAGHYLDKDPVTGKTAVMPTTPADAVSRNPIGVQKQSIVSLLYSSGNLANANHTTFPAYMNEAYQRLQQGEPYDGDPEIEQIVDWFLTDRSAYYQERFWKQVGNGLRVPVFSATTWTDPLFPAMQSGVAFYNKMKSIAPKYPFQMYLGDYQHFVANKAKEWDDLCGDDRRVCTLDDYRNAEGVIDFDRAATRVRLGVNTRVNKFLDFYLRRKGVTPPRKVWATTTICVANAKDGYPVDEPGIEYTARSWRALAPETMRFAWKGGGAVNTTTTSGAVDNHAVESDPAYRSTQPNKCYTTPDSDAAPGVVQYEDTVDEAFTLMGLPALNLTYTASAATPDYWIAARLFDKEPDGTITLVTRGVCKVNEAAAPEVDCSRFELWGNGWTFEKGNSILLEITQSDTPMFRRSNYPSSIAYEAAELKLPVTIESLRKDFRD